MVFQKASHVWRGRAKSIHEAIDQGTAGIGVDMLLARTAMRKGAVAVIVVNEELAGIWAGRISDLFDPSISRTREGFSGRSVKVVDIDRFAHRTLEISLKPKRKRAIEAA